MLDLQYDIITVETRFLRKASIDHQCVLIRMPVLH